MVDTEGIGCEVVVEFRLRGCAGVFVKDSAHQICDEDIYVAICINIDEFRCRMCFARNLVSR